MLKHAHQGIVGWGRRARSRRKRRSSRQVNKMARLETALSRIFRYRLLAIILASVAAMGPQASHGATTTLQGSPSVDTLIAWLGDPSTAWVATAWLQQIGEPALPALLTPGDTQPGPHDRFSPRMLALAKIGEPAIAHIAERLTEILRTQDSRNGREAFALILVLGAIGPAAIPALVEVASNAPPTIASSALDEIIELEPAESFGQEVDLWSSWRPQDDRLEQIARQVTPILPRVKQIMDRGVREWPLQAHAPQRPAAYLLARWGTRLDRSRGLEILDELARAEGPFYSFLSPASLLYRLGAEGIGAILRRVAAQVPATDDLKDQFFLRLGISLFRIRDESYLDLVVRALRSANLYARIEAIRFAGRAGDLRLVSPLIDLLGDKTETGNQTIETVKGRTVRTRDTVADVAANSLGRLTLHSTSRDGERWRAWWKLHQRSSRRELLSEFLSRRLGRIKSVPIWQANRWIDELGTTTDPLILPLISAYIDRRDLDESAVGPNAHEGSGGIGPFNLSAPRVVTLLLRFAQLGHEQGRSILEHAMRAADPEVRLYAALAVGTYNRQAALDRLAREFAQPEPWLRQQAAYFLLLFDDARGIPALIDRLEQDHEATRHMACQDLRLYTQQPLPCDATLPQVEREVNIKLWRSWWSTVSNFQPKRRQAMLDPLAIPEVLPVSYKQGFRVARGGVVRATSPGRPALEHR